VCHNITVCHVMIINDTHGAKCVKALLNNYIHLQASFIIGRVEQYLSNNPNIIVIDPLDNLRILLSRYYYALFLTNYMKMILILK
jgi:hypothetical protein